MIYQRRMRIEFNHCDPAGIVFYPRYYEMTNSVAENFFRDVAAFPYDQMMQQGEGVPTAALQTRFSAPSRLGELLDWTLEVRRLGRSSLDLTIAASGEGQLRLSTDLTLVYVTAGGRPQPWPQEVRDRIAQFMEAA